MFIAISLAVSCLFLALVFATSRIRNGAAVVFGLAFVGLPVFCAGSYWFFSPVLLLQCLLTLVTALVCLVVRAKRNIVFASSVGAAFVSYGVAIWVGAGQFQKRVELRKEYPLESISARLIYENRNQQETKPSSVPLSSEVEQRLKEFEERSNRGYRRYLLESLHDQKRDEFVMASGFGNVRMLRATKEQIDLPKPDPIPLPSPPYEPKYESSDGESIPLANEPVILASRSVQEQLLAMHRSGLDDFLDPERMGYVRDREHVAGFESHAFQRMPKVDPEVTEEKWQVTRLELVSLLKHNVPMVYVAATLPQMDELKNAATRPLDMFERKALEQLRRSEDLVVESDVNRIRMVGSLRAGKGCLECHSVERGDLLGAFSYDLHRVRPVPKKKEPIKPKA